MRLWSLAPSLLDRAALVACWREALLAQKVLNGGTKGYTRHPQLTRFRDRDDPVQAIGAYLTGLRAEASSRGYRFDATRILESAGPRSEEAETGMTVTDGQLRYELDHLRRKVTDRAPEWLIHLPEKDSLHIPPHPLLTVVAGDIEPWEVITAGQR